MGTGTGIWAIEYGTVTSITVHLTLGFIRSTGDDHPDTEILGTDLSPTQPSW